MLFWIGDEQLFIEDGITTYNEIRSAVEKMVGNMHRDFIKKFYEKYNDMDSAVEGIRDYSYSYLLQVIEQGVSFLNSEGVHSYNSKRIISEYYEQITRGIDSALDEYESAYIEIVKDKNEAAEYRKMRKENRGRWVGGGFGVEGAVKGAVTAGAANLAAGIAHSAFNAVGNAVSSVSANIRKDKLYNDINTLSLVESGLSVSMCEVLNVIANIAYINGLEIVMPDKSKDFLNHCDAIIDNIENGYLSDKERIYEECGIILRKNPYYVKAYNLLLQKYGDKLGGIYQMAKYFGLKSIVKSRKEQFDKMLAEINLSSSQAIKNSAEKITRYAEQNGSMSMCASEALRFILQNIVVKSIEENKLPDDADKITGIEFDSSNITNTDIEVVDKIINILIDDDENETAVENAIKGWQDFEKKRMSDDEVINVRYSNLILKSDEELKKLKESVKAEILLDENIKNVLNL